jgi:hypothetical protein
MQEILSQYGLEIVVGMIAGVLGVLFWRVLSYRAKDEKQD